MVSSKMIAFTVTDTVGSAGYKLAPTIGTELPESFAAGQAHARLAAIVYLDMAGYSRLMELDEVGTLAELRGVFNDVLRPLAAREGGRVANTAGDSALLLFQSTGAAVRFAVAFQQAVAARETGAVPDRAMLFRIGVAIADVLETAGADVHGHGVNLAARLQAACPVGAVCVTRGVRDQVLGKLDAVFEPAGPLQLKNMACPVEAYIVRQHGRSVNQSRRDGLSGMPRGAAYPGPNERVTARSGPEHAAVPGDAFAVSNVPVHVPAHFMGRDDALATIQAALARDAGRVAIAALHGLRGVGKTTLAAAYAERHRGNYRATWWVRAQTEPTMRADLIALGVRLGWVGSEDKDQPALAAVMERLRQEGEGILLVFDNAIDPRELMPYLPPGGAARVLVTTNAHSWRGLAEPVQIRFWPKAVGADFLIARTGRAAERDAAEALSKTLGGLPLAHEQTAAYCERLGVSLADYARRLAAAPVQMLDKGRYAPAEYYDGLSVARTFELAIEQAAKMHPAAEVLIGSLALLAPEPVPLFLLREGREALGEPLASLLAEEEELDEAIAALRAFALVDAETIVDERDREVTTKTIRLHRLVREVAAARLPTNARHDARRALVAALSTVYPQGVFDNPRTWPRARRLDTLALALVGGEAEVPEGAEEQASRLLNGLGSYRHGVLAAYSQARPLLERALAIRERVLGPEHPHTAASLRNLASLLRAQGDLAGARPLSERALEIRERVLGPEHPDTAASLNILSSLRRDQGDLAGARPLSERALEIRERVLGPEHPDTAVSLNNLAFLLQAQGDLAGALPLFERSLAIRERVFGPEHPETAVGLNNLAFLLQAQGDLAGARPLFERALAISEMALGPQHPNTNRYRSKFARLLLGSERPAEATALGERALAAHEAVLGATHGWTRDSARVTADAYDAFGRSEEASALRRRYGLS